MRREPFADADSTEAADYVEVVRRLWDSWEDDAEIRDVATGRFIDRDKLHYIDFEGRFFKVRGPVDHAAAAAGAAAGDALAHGSIATGCRRRPTSVFVTRATSRAPSIVAAIRVEQVRSAAPRACSLRATWWCSWTTTAAAARPSAGPDWMRWRRLGHRDAHVFAGTPSQLADLLLDWHVAGLDGFRLRPAALPHDLARDQPAAWCRSCSRADASAPRTRPARCAGCSAWPGPPTATPTA